jgi:DNA invertase Pin-like site-specific DNA recombinase
MEVESVRQKILGYIRVSTDKQDLNNQRLELLEYARNNGFHIDDFIEAEVSSRKSTQARRIDEVQETLQEGDTLLVPDLSRLGRSVGQVIQIIDGLIKKKVKFVSVKERIRIEGEQDIQTKTMVTMFGLFAEIERDLISQRTKQGLAAARERGKLLGRPKGKGKSKLDEHRLEIEALLQNGTTKAFIARRYKTSLPNLYNWLEKIG